MSSAIVSPSSFNVNNITISAPKLLPSNAKQAYLNYDNRSLTMQVGSLSIPYGMSVFDKAGPVKYSVDMSLRGYEGEIPKVKAIYDAFAALDAFMLEQGVKNSKLWFKSDLNKDVIKAFYTPCLRFSKDAEGNPKPYPPTLKVSLRQRDGKFETVMYDENKQVMTLPMEEILVKGAQITTLIQCTGVWFAGSKYGLSWKAVQIRADKLPEGIRGFAFVDDGDAPKRPAPAPAPAKPVNNFQALAEEEDVDDEEAFAPPTQVAPKPSFEEDVPPIALPTKTITKKTIVKKVVAGTK